MINFTWKHLPIQLILFFHFIPGSRMLKTKQNVYDSIHFAYRLSVSSMLNPNIQFSVWNSKHDFNMNLYDPGVNNKYSDTLERKFVIEISGKHLVHEIWKCKRHIKCKQCQQTIVIDSKIKLQKATTQTFHASSRIESALGCLRYIKISNFISTGPKTNVMQSPE